MNVYFTDHFVLPLPPGHRFPMEKYARLRERVGGLGAGFRLRQPAAATDDELSLVHQREYLARVVSGTLSRDEIRRIGFPWSPELVERSRRSVGATLSAARSAFDDGVSVSLAGGTHHAFPGRGEGYCVFNDVGVAARAVLREGRVAQVAVVDLDVHQGNGTAAIFAGDPGVYTLSIHGASNFPFRKETSDDDVALPDGAGDEEYQDALEAALERLESRVSPEIVLYLAGADPWEGDRLGRLSLTRAGLARRDRTVLERFRARGVPVAVVMGGGYAPGIDDIVDIHLETVRVAGAVAGVTF